MKENEEELGYEVKQESRAFLTFTFTIGVQVAIKSVQEAKSLLNYFTYRQTQTNTSNKTLHRVLIRIMLVLHLSKRLPNSVKLSSFA